MAIASLNYKVFRGTRGQGGCCLKYGIREAGSRLGTSEAGQDFEACCARDGHTPGTPRGKVPGDTGTMILGCPDFAPQSDE